MSDRVSLLMGVVCGLTGLGMLTHLDFPVIQHGGILAGFAAVELLAAAAVMSVLLGLAAREW